jgi:hypothetical protein
MIDTYRFLNQVPTKGYHLEHNFGHGKKDLSALFVTFNLLAFLFHTVLEIMDGKYNLLRRELPTRETFFQDLRALTRLRSFFLLRGAFCLEMDF